MIMLTGDRMREKDKYLSSRKVLVVEDEYLLADELLELLNGAGATVLGPVATATDALTLLLGGAKPDLAILDIDLKGQDVYSVSDALAARKIPFIFATGYSEVQIVQRFRHIARAQKPISTSKLDTLLRNLVA